ncbi:MAG: hypothetical protein WBB22_02165 [Anaerolineae bacterium]
MPGLPIGQKEQERYCLTKRYTSCPLFLSQSIQERPAERIAMAEAVRREVAAEPRLGEPMETLPAQEGPPDKRAEVVLTETGPEPAVEVPLKEKIEPLLGQELLANELSAAEVRAEEPSIVVEPPPSTIPTTGTGAKSVVFRALPWIAAGTVLVTLLCFGAVISVRVVGTSPDISLPSLRLSSLWPGALLLVSVTSFVGAILLIGLFLWTRRSGSK